jgi:hypothetical protein
MQLMEQRVVGHNLEIEETEGLLVLVVLVELQLMV